MDLRSSGTYGSKRDIEREAHIHDVGFRWRHIETPDTQWIKDRNHEMIYLTGAHPINAEPPFSKLMESGLITDNQWHFVRNHGDVPQLDWEKHEIIIEGFLKKQRIIKMNELQSMPKEWQIDIPITITCDGNRRKEINLIKRTRGFNWGPGATATARWKGVSLHYLLLHYCEGISIEGKEKIEKDNPLYICFEGSDQLVKGEYGMSMPLEWALDRTKDFMLAYEMNGERLTADHGFPVRLILPGFVGGRMIKWLKRIVISDKPSDSHYHYFDNRLLPPNIDFDEGNMKGYFQSPDTILYEMNLNSVIYKPSYGEIITISDVKQKYEICGYAYSGGGRKITRVEVTMDEGKTWMEGKINYPEKAVRHGSKYWTWCHWSLECDSWRFLHTKEMAVRAFDSSFNTQPENITWNALGVMNNTWYRVRINVEDANVPWITFHHPVKQGSLYGGWMMPTTQTILEYKQLRVMPMSAEIAFARGEFSKEISLEEVAKHNTKDDCWVTIDDAVYDLTGYLREHPGGGNSILAYAGGDASRAFHDIHDQAAFESKEMFRIGTLAPPRRVKGHRRDGESKLLHPQQWVPFVLSKKENIAKDIRLFTFELEGDNAGKQLGLPTGQHVLLSIQNQPHDFVVRPYTPIYPCHHKEDKDGKLVFLIKIYKLGKMTQLLDKMEIGSQIGVKGPSGPIMYLGDTKFFAHGKIVKATRLSMVAGGTGITPIYQMTKAILEGESSRQFEIRLITANNSIEDIPLRKELDDLEKAHSNRLKVWHTVSTISPDQEKDWKYSVGRIDQRMMRDHLLVPVENGDSLALVCGPPGMVAHCCFPSLEELGFTDDNLFEF